MKRVLLFLCIGVMFASCQKRHCWKCTVYQHTEPNGPIAENTHTEVVCDKNRAEIRRYERQNTWTHTNGIVTVTQRTECK